jgi:hypothetical protein
MSHSKVEFGDQKTQWTGGAGKGDAERPVNRRKFREALDKIKWNGTNGKVASKSGIKTTYIDK